MATWQIFGPLMRVPSALLNRLQLIFDRRGNGAGNTATTALDAVSTFWDFGKIQVSLDRPASGVMPIAIDTGLNWIDRKLTISFSLDPTMDVRPGHAADLSYAHHRGTVTWYSGLGNSSVLLSPLLAVYVGPTGNLYVTKDVCYASLQIVAGTQQKERS